MANGTFTPSALVATQAKMSLIVADKDSPVNRIYANKTWNLVKALMNEQVVVPGQVQATGKDYTVDIAWPEMIGLSTTTGVAACDLGSGAEAGTYKQSYTIDEALKLNNALVIDENDLISNLFTPEEVRAQLFLQADSAMLDGLQAKALTFLEANFSNGALNGNGYTTDADGIWVPDASYNADLVADIQIAASMNQLGSYFLIAGPQFMRNAILAGAKEGNLDGKGAYQLLNGENFYFDVHNMPSLEKKPIFQVANSVFCWVKKNEHEATVQEITADKKKFTVNSVLMPGLTYDVIEERSCSAGNKTSYKYQFQLRNKLILHPQSQSATTNKGIIKWLNGTPE